MIIPPFRGKGGGHEQQSLEVAPDAQKPPAVVTRHVRHLEPADAQQLPVVLAHEGTQAQALQAVEIDADEAGTTRDADELTVGAAVAEQASLTVATKETAAAVPVACEGHSGSNHEHAANEYSDGPTAYLHLRSPFGSSYLHLGNIAVGPPANVQNDPF